MWTLIFGWSTTLHNTVLVGQATLYRWWVQLARLILYRLWLHAINYSIILWELNLGLDWVTTLGYFGGSLFSIVFPLERCSAQADASSSPVSFLTPDSHGFQRVRDDLRRRHGPGGQLNRQKRHFNHRRYHHAKSVVHETEVIVEAFDSYHLLELVPVQVIGLTTCVNCHFVASRAFQKTNTFYVTYCLGVSEPVRYRLPRRIMNWRYWTRIWPIGSRAVSPTRRRRSDHTVSTMVVHSAADQIRHLSTCAKW